MIAHPSHDRDKRSGKDRRHLPDSKSIYEWNFDTSGNWWKERRSGRERRRPAKDAYERLSSQGATASTPTERRQYARYQVPGFSAYAVLKRPWPRSPVMAEIIEISPSGLSFCYTASGKEPCTSSELDILLTDGSFSLTDIPFRILTDVPIDDTTSLGFTARRCGGQFGELAEKQRFDLLHFIQTYTTADPEA